MAPTKALYIYVKAMWLGLLVGLLKMESGAIRNA